MAINSDQTIRDREILAHLLKTLSVRDQAPYRALFDRLAKANCPAPVCVAGAIFSLYPTKDNPSASADRDKVRQLCGNQIAEDMAYVFSRIERPGSLDSGEPWDWETSKPIHIQEAALHDLNLIEAARLLENGQSLAPYRHIHMTWRRYSK
jgi:hypothetical protein